VELARSNGSFSFQVENSREEPLNRTLLPGGIGLNNVKRRLELLYPDKHSLQIHNDETTFKVELELKI
jgi:LytS/YehU family sensor histidine kinase